MSVQYALCQKTSGSCGPLGRGARSSALLLTQAQEVMGFPPMNIWWYSVFIWMCYWIRSLILYQPRYSDFFLLFMEFSSTPLHQCHSQSPFGHTVQWNHGLLSRLVLLIGQLLCTWRASAWDPWSLGPLWIYLTVAHAFEVLTPQMDLQQLRLSRRENMGECSNYLHGLHKFREFTPAMISLHLDVLPGVPRFSSSQDFQVFLMRGTRASHPN